MSSVSENCDLKGGHAPAVKVGGMRVVQHKRQSESEKAPEEKSTEESETVVEDEENQVETEPTSEEKATEAYQKTNKDFPKQAISSFHTKPTPTKDLNAHAKPHHQQIQQPRKD